MCTAASAYASTCGPPLQLMCCLIIHACVSQLEHTHHHPAPTHPPQLTLPNSPSSHPPLLAHASSFQAPTSNSAASYSYDASKKVVVSSVAKSGAGVKLEFVQLDVVKLACFTPHAECSSIAGTLL